MVTCSIDPAHCAPVQLRVDCTSASCFGNPIKVPDVFQQDTVALTVAEATQQTAAVEGLLQRLLPHHAHLFKCKVVPQSSGFYSVVVKDGHVNMEGSSGVDLAAGINWLLKNCLNSSVTWAATGGAQIDTSALDRLQDFECHEKVTINRSFPFSYYQNIVTLSYSMAYWDWDRWEAEIDWMALQGINLPLAPVGMEFIWVETYKQLGLAPEDLEDFFPGPSFLAWGRMGNIQGWGGPLPKGYMEKQAKLQMLILERMRSYGMAPVLPAFAGFVPKALVNKHPEAEVTQISRWCHFAEPYCCPYILAPTDPLFHTIGTTFIRTLRHHYGADRVGYYAADCFNEMRPSSAAPEYLSRMSASVYRAMADADPSSVWIMQAWLFFSDPQFWQPPQVQALLKGVARGRLLLLDLFAEEHPLWERTAAFQGYPFIWCMLHNFGGNLEMYGALPSVTAGLERAAAAAPMGLVGVGMAPEGLEQNPIVYDFMADKAFKAPQPLGGLQGWARQYAVRRYGAAALQGSGGASSKEANNATSLLQEAWAILATTAYSCSDRSRSTVRDVPTSRPGLSRGEIMGWGLAPHLWYDLRQLVRAWRLVLAAGGVEIGGLTTGMEVVSGDEAGDQAAVAARLGRNAAYKYDLADVSREVMSKAATGVWLEVVRAYTGREEEALRQSSAQLLELLDDMEQLLRSHESFMLGPYLQKARDYADTEAEAQLYEWNARTQISIWGTSPSGDSEVSDYANREWAGLISTFYRPRWAMWLSRLQEDLALQRPYDAEAWRQQALSFTLLWASTSQQLPSQPQGDLLQLSARMYPKYSALVERLAGGPLAAL